MPGKILGMDPWLAAAGAAAAVLGAAYFLLHRSSAAGGSGAGAGQGGSQVSATVAGTGGLASLFTPAPASTGGSMATVPVGPLAHPRRPFHPVRPAARARGPAPVTLATAAVPLATGPGPGSSLPASAAYPAGLSPAGGSVGIGGLVWPFPVKSATQYRRIDQGWDLQYAGTKPVPVLAIAPGRVVSLGPDPGGFGQAYPGLMLNKPIAGQSEVYYGHTFLAPGIAGKRVKAGQVIGYTGGAHSGGDAYADPNWLEIGFFPPGPMGGGGLIRRVLAGARPLTVRRPAPAAARPPGPGPGGTLNIRAPITGTRPPRRRLPALPLLPPPRRPARRPSVSPGRRVR